MRTIDDVRSFVVTPLARSTATMGVTYSKPNPKNKVYDIVVDALRGRTTGDVVTTTNATNAFEGKTIVITGSSTGLGVEIAKTCAMNGGKVIMLNRPSARAEEAVKMVGNGAKHVDCDLQSFASTRAAAKRVMEESKGVVDVLILNAGVMALPFDATGDGYDVQMQTNVISHFLLTRELFPALLKSKHARVVSQSSLAAKMSVPLRSESFEKAPKCTSWTKSTWDVYGQTKLSNLVFTEELQKRIDAAGVKNVIAVAAHPGIAATELQVTTSKNPGRGASSGQLAFLSKLGLFQSQADGATPSLVAAFGANVVGGDFYGPSRVFECKGAPKKLVKDKKVTPEACATLWSGCQAATGISFDI